MSKYTTELHYICESLAGMDHVAGYDEIDSVIDKTVDKIMPIYPLPVIPNAEEARAAFNKKFLKAYWTREIGSETYGLWKLRLAQRLNELAPYYNQLYESAEFKYNPFDTMDLHRVRKDKKSNTGNNIGEIETHDRKNGKIDTSTTNGGSSDTTFDGTATSSGSSEGSSTNTSNGSRGETNRFSDTPQSALDLMTGEFSKDNRWLTTATVIDGTNKETNTGTTNTSTTGTNTDKSTTGVKTQSSGSEKTETIDDAKGNRVSTNEYMENTNIDYDETITGLYHGTDKSKLIREYRDAIINIDAMFIDALADMFMLIY